MGGATQGEAAAAAGVSDTTWNNVENGRSASERSLARIGQHLWGDASVPASILDGGEPPPVDHTNGATTPPELLTAVLDLTQAVRDLREDIRRGRR